MATPLSPGAQALMGPNGVSPMKSRNSGRRLSSDEISKYEKPLPYHVDDFMNVYLAEQSDPNAPKDPLIAEMAASIQDQIRTHYVLSSKTRLAFSTMDNDVVWQDVRSKTIRLTKRNLATLDPKFVPILDEYVHNVFRDLIEPMRTKIRATLEATYAHESEVSEVEAEMAALGPEPQSYQHANVGVHAKLYERYMTELKQKYAVVEFARKRELFLSHLVAWEAKHKTTSAVPAKGKNDLLNWIPKFKISAAKTLEKANATLEELVSEYEKASHKTFAMNGVEYMPNFYKKQVAQISTIKTNFAHFTADILYFDNPRGGQEGQDIVGRVLDPCIVQDAEEAGALQLPSPPEMPIYSDKVDFAFEYY